MSEITANELKALADAQTELRSATKDLRSWMEKADGEIESAKKVDGETRSAIEKLSERAAELTERCMTLEQRMTAPREESRQLSIGEQFTKQDGFDRWQQSRAGSFRMEFKTAIVNATGQNQPLVPSHRLAGIDTAPNRLLTIRDILPVGRTSSNLVEYTKENVFTNSAGPQYGSPAYENVAKPESAITFTLATTAVTTLAHFIPVSKQVLADSPMLQSYINGRLMYGLKLEEEDQLLNGDGTSGNLSGLLDSGNYTAYSRGVTGDTEIDTLRRAITQAQLANYPVDAFVLNPADWESIEIAKGTDNHYVWSHPAAMAGPQLWGRRVVVSNSITAGTFLCGAFSMGAQIWDREDASVQVSYEHSENFTKNMATILAEERLALAVYRAAAFISGSL